jgi:hypothetical protein
MAQVESPQRIEPTRLEEISEPVSDALAALSTASARLGSALHPRTAAHLADIVRIMNSYYSNLIGPHHPSTRHRARAARQFR